ncbi:MAG: PilC/PilY family type IV pilus protein [Pseudomonadales bacterium]
MKYLNINRLIRDGLLALALASISQAGWALTAGPDENRALTEDFASQNVSLPPNFSGEVPPVTYAQAGTSGDSVGTVVSFNPFTGDVVIDPIPDASGIQTFRFTASDAAPSSAGWDLTLTVTAVNDPPTFVAGGDETVDEDDGAQTVPAWATVSPGPADESGQSLSFNIVSNSNPALFSVQPDVDDSGELTYTPAPDAFGTATITANMNDDGGGTDTSASDTFTITVNPANDPPSFTAGSDQTVDEDSSGTLVAAWASGSAGPANESAQALTYNVTGNTDPGLFSVQPAVDGATGDLTFTVAPDRSGSADITLNVSDDGGGSDTSGDQTFTIDVTDINDAPSFAVGADVAVDEDSGPQTIVTWATAISPGPADESGQSVTFTVGNDNAPLFAAAPTVDPAGTLTFTPAPDMFGTATVTISVSDDGGTAGGGIDTSADQVFNITVGDVNDEPSFNAGSDETVIEDAGAQTVPGWATALDTGSTEEATQTLTFNIVSVSDPALFDVLPAVDGTSGDLTYTPAADANGTATITLNVQDDGGTANGGDDTSADQSFDITVTAVNDVPSFTSGGDVGADEDAGVVTIPGWASAISAGPADESAQILSFNVVGNSDPSLFDVQPLVNETNGDLTFTPAADRFGTATITLNVSDSGGTADGGVDTSADQAFNISIGEVNDEPSFAAGGDETILEDAGSQTVPGWATALDTGSAEEAAQTLTFNIVSVSNPALFATLPVVDGVSGDLSYTPADDANGSATITLNVQDDGGTASGGDDTSPDQTFDINVTAVNDTPTFTPGPTVNVAEDAGPVTVSAWATGMSPGPADESTQILVFNVVGNTNPALFSTPPAIDPASGDLTFQTAVDANGSADIAINLSDDGGLANGGDNTSDDVTFTINVSGVNDFPAAADDSAVMDEDAGPILIDVLANDYLAEPPTAITAAGVGGASESDPVIVLDENDDPIGGPNGTVSIVGSQIQYEPKADYYGVDFFSYTMTDSNGDTSSATVTVTVNPINDPPTAPAQRNFSMLENDILEVDVNDGLLFGSYDVEGARLDAFGNPMGATLTILPQTLPVVGVVSIDNGDGSFTYTPPINFVGEVTFTYRVNDGSDQSSDYEARIVVYEAPDPPAPPPAGEVSVTFNLSNVPLEQSTSVSPNVLVMMDDSGSMDWNVSVRGADDNGGFVVDNDPIATSNERSTTYYYLWDLDTNIFGDTSTNGRITPADYNPTVAGLTGLQNDNNTDNNQYGVWRVRNAQYNRLYYNPEVHYTPWIGLDNQNNDFADANPVAVRLDPRDPFDTFNIMNNHTYRSDNIPRWQTNGNREDQNHTIYIPHYYSTTATAPLAWNDPHTLVEIRPGNAPFDGGPGREDCAADDGDPLDCTYAQEIQNFANFFQYYRTREYAAKNGLGKVISQVQDVRVGYETINDNRTEEMAEMNDLYSEGNKLALMDEIYRTNSGGGTPLRRALDRAGDLFAGSGDYDPLLPDPEGFCQQNFTLLFSDGYWNGGDPAQDNEDGDNSSDFDGGRYADGIQETLADVAMYFYERDIRPGMDDLVPVAQRDRVAVPAGTFPATGNARMHQHMKTFTVAFGVVGDVDPLTIPVDPTVPFAWPDPEGTPQGKIDDMLHAAVNGRGQFLSAVNPQELQTALESAFLEFTQAASSTSAAAFNSTSLQEGTLLYRGFYDLRDFTGELSATLLNPDGTLAATPEWVASEQLNPANKLPNNRVLVTFDPANREGIPFRHGDLTPDQQLMMNADEVDYIRGVRSAEQPGGPLRRRNTTGGLLGDIVNSSPVFVGSPRGLNRDQAPYPEGDLYSDFQDDKEGRLPVVYVGANDGILHGFDAATGEELFGFVPNKVIDASQNYHSDLEDFTSPFYQHQYFVDLSPRVSDAYVRPGPGVGSRSWNSVLLGGLGAGGKGFFALNVTDPGSDFSSENNAEDVVMWEFTDEDDSSPSAATDPFGAPVKDLGYSLSLPSLAMSNVPDGDGNEWVAIFGNGPNSTAGVAKLYVLFPDRGMDGWGAGDYVKLDTGRGVPIAPEQLAGYPNGLGSPALVDIDLNGTVDWVYAGDRLGNLYRFDLCDQDPVTLVCSTSTGDWSVTRIFTATYDEGGFERLQPILTQPLVIKHPDEDGFLVIFGTGSYIAREDADNEEIQSIYAIWDRGEDSPATALDDSKELRLVEQVLTNEVDDSVAPPVTRRVLTRNVVEYEPDDGVTEGTYGWYIDLDMERATDTVSGAANGDTSGRAPPSAQFPGEKAIRRLLLRNGAIITTTVLPSLDEFSCYGTRPGAILLFDAVTGGDLDRPVIDFNNDGEIDAGDLLTVDGEAYAAGLLFNQSDLDGALVDLTTLGGQGDSDWLFACGGNDCVPFEIEPLDDTRTGRLSWRELDDIN